MITIRKNNHTLQVSKSTYKTMFENIGYKIVEEADKKASSTKNNVKETKTKVENSEKTIEDKKIGDLSKEDSNLSSDKNKELKVENKSKKEEKDNELNDILKALSNKKENKK